MSTRNLALLLIPLVIIAGFLLSLGGIKCKGFKCGGASEPQSVSSGIVYDGNVERVVEQFGEAMKRVSLQSPSLQVESDIKANYAPYVAPELIDAWVADPQSAPGRLTSSPWPERIQIGMMEGSENNFVVHGTVIDVANGDEGEQIVGTYPVKLRLEKRGDSWLIVHYDKGDYSVIPARKTITGTFTCLPHRDTTGPQTLECAFGLREDGTGDHYSINTQLMASLAWQEIPTGSRVRVSGVMTPVEMLSSDHWQKYDIVGIISATTIERI